MRQLTLNYKDMQALIMLLNAVITEYTNDSTGDANIASALEHFAEIRDTLTEAVAVANVPTPELLDLPTNGIVH